MNKYRFFIVIVGLFLGFSVGGPLFAANLSNVQTIEQFRSLPADVQQSLKEQYLSDSSKTSTSQPTPLLQGIATSTTEVAVHSGEGMPVVIPVEVHEEGVSLLEQQYRHRYQSSLSGSLSQFGYNLFALASPQVLQNVVPDESYVIVPGDQMRVRLWGATVDTQYVAQVDADGTVNLPQIGVIPVAGEQLGQLDEKIKREALKYMQGINVSVALEKLHSVEVYVVGEVANPGLHVVPAFSTLLKGLQAAGGVKKSGTLRSLTLYRGGQVQSRLDLYDFIFSGNRNGDRPLRNQDVIFVPRIGDTVAVAGAVSQPAIYELRTEGEVGQALELAGGFLPNALSQNVYIKRYDEKNAFQVHDVQFSKMATTDVHPGDLIEVRFAPQLPARAVTLEGHVKVPQTLAYAPGLKLSDILTGVDALMPEALTEFALLHRYNQESTRYEVQKFALGQFLDQKIDIELEPYDRIEILSRKDLGINESVSIAGAVWRPGTYPFQPEMKVADLLALGGGVKENEFMAGNAYLYRYDSTTLQYRLQRLDLDQSLNRANSLVLQPFDRIELQSRSDFNFDEPVRIAGAVRKPGEYICRNRMSIRDLIDMAGGETFGAQPDRVEVTRVAIQDGESSTTHFIVELSQHKDFLLLPYDYVLVPKVKDATKISKMEISGEVLYPGVYSVQEGERLSDVIRRAGGFTNQAYYYGAMFSSEQAREIQQQNIDKMISRMQFAIQRATAESAQLALSTEGVATAEVEANAATSLITDLKKIRANGRVSMNLGPLSEFAGSAHDFKVHDGDSLVVPPRPGFVAVVGSVYSPNSFVYQAGMTIGDYLAQSGGPTKEADEDFIYVQRANGEVLSAQQSGMFSRFYSQELMPGDTIVVMENMDRIPALRLFKDVTEIIFRIATTAGIAFAI